MARFIVLKDGLSQTVFDFDGSIARIGSGAMVDLRLEAAGFEGDLFFLTKTPNGYEIEKRADNLNFTVNGSAVGNRALLKEGDKVAFLNYLIVASYSGSARPAKPPEVITRPPAGQARISPQETSPPKPVQESKPVFPEPIEEKPKATPARGSERPTTFINLGELQAKPTPTNRSQTAPPRERIASPKVTDPNVHAPQPKQAEPPKQDAKKRIEATYALVGLSGQHKGKTILIDTKEFVVGRDRGLCDLVIDHDERGQLDDSISREHFTISSTDEGLYLTDRRSKLRTFVNRKALESDQREFITPEDIISIPAPTGELKFRLCYVGQENFAPDRPPTAVWPIIVLAVLIVVLIIVLIWLLGA